MSITTGLPSVRVPVLSTAKTVIFCASSSATALRIKMPCRAPCPLPTMIAVGVAKPSAQGQAITSTATALTSAVAKSPISHQPMISVSTATATTTGTKIAATRSVKRCTGAREPCADSTKRMIPASNVWLPTPVARQRKSPSPLIVAANTLSPVDFVTGKLSPVNIASTNAELPARITPSTGTASPPRTTNTSPGIKLATGTLRSSPSLSIWAVCGCSPISVSIASVVLALARVSNILPSNTSVMTVADASK